MNFSTGAFHENAYAIKWMRTQHRALRGQILLVLNLNMGGTAKEIRPMAILVAMGFFIGNETCKYMPED